MLLCLGQLLLLLLLLQQIRFRRRRRRRLRLRPLVFSPPLLPALLARVRVALPLPRLPHPPPHRRPVGEELPLRALGAHPALGRQQGLLPGLLSLLPRQRALERIDR